VRRLGPASYITVKGERLTPAMIFARKVMLFMRFMFTKAGDEQLKEYRALMTPCSQGKRTWHSGPALCSGLTAPSESLEGIGTHLMYQVALEGLNAAMRSTVLGEQWPERNPGSSRSMEALTDYLEERQASENAKRRERKLAAVDAADSSSICSQQQRRNQQQQAAGSRSCSWQQQFSRASCWSHLRSQRL